MRFQLISYFVILNGFASIGQQLYVQQYPSEVYKGATQNWEMEQDDQGILYFANNDGVLIHDGYEWNLVPFPNKDFVFSIALDGKGKIYVSSYNELGYFEKDSSGNYRYQSLVYKLPKDYQKFKYLSQIVVSNNDVFFVDYEAIYRYVNNEFEVLNERLVKVIKHHDKIFFVKKDGLYLLKDKALVPADLNNELNGTTIKWISAYEQNTFLMLDDKNQLWKIDPDALPGHKLLLVSTALNAHLKDLPKFKMLLLNNGNLAILSSNELRFTNKEGELLYSITKNMIDEDFTYRILYEDKQHNLWVTTQASILQVITSSPISYYDKHNGLNGVMLSLGKKDEHRYVGTNTGIFYQENETTFSMLPGTDGEAWNFYNFNDKVYVAHGMGVMELNGKTATRIITHNFVHALCTLKNRPNHMIMGTFTMGIWLLEKKQNAWSKTKIKGFEEETRFILEDEEGNLWISHYNRGIFKLRLNETMDSVISQTFYDSNHGLPSNLNNRIYRLSNGKMLVTTAKGFYRYNKLTNRFDPVEELNEILGEDFCIYNITESAQGDIYFWAGLAHDKEFAGVLKKQQDEGYKLLLTPFNRIGIPIRDLRVDVDAPLLEVSDNEVWIGSHLMLKSYNPLQKTFYEDPFHTFIKEVWANDSALSNHTKNIPYSLNRLRFTFASSFYEKPEKTEYQYKLHGFQNEWSNWSAIHEASFTNLPHGNYTFSVRARNLYGKLSEPSSFSVYINPPWYYTWWASLLYVLAAVSFVGLIVQMNTKRIRQKKLKLEKKVHKKTKALRAKNKEVLVQKQEIIKQAEELEALNLAKDKLFSIISHDLRAPIKQIQVIMNLMELNHLSEEEFKAYIPRFKESIEHTVNLTDNLLHWANSQMEGIQVKPTCINLQEIAEENYQLFKPLAESKNIQLINNINSNVLAFADKDMIKLVLRNLVNNAVKFTKAHETVIIGAEANHKQIEVFVKDTGVGLSREEIAAILSKKNFTKTGTFGEKGVGLGLLLCQEFITKNGGDINIESEVGTGSKFTFRIPSC